MLACPPLEGHGIYLKEKAPSIPGLFLLQNKTDKFQLELNFVKDAKV